MRNVSAAGRFSSLLAFTLLLAGCGGGAGGGAAAAAPRGSADRIVAAELEAVPQLSAYEAIQRLRPRWLVTRSGGMPQVHVNGNIQMGGVEALRTVRAADIQEIRYLNAADATTRFGTNYVSGAILVTTRG